MAVGRHPLPTSSRDEWLDSQRVRAHHPGRRAWAFAGAGIWELTPLYIGEVVSVWAFAASWLVAGFYLTAPARTGTSVETRDRGTAPAAASATNQ